MTKLNKTVRRETSAKYLKRPIIIQLEPGGVIRLKEKGRRIWYETTIEAVFSMAAKTYVKGRLDA